MSLLYTIIIYNYTTLKADLKGMETTTDGRFVKEFDKQIGLFPLRSVVLGMGDGSMTTLTIADPEKEGIGDYLKSLPSRHTPSLCDQIVVTSP